MNHTTLLRMPVPLSHEAHQQAAQFAAEQATAAKSRQVYLNTLAVYAVHTYLNWLEIRTDLTQSDCWQPGLRALFDIADLVVPDIGTLECRPVSPGAESFTMPPAEHRIGYVAVRFQEELNAVELLGFVRAAVDEPSEPLEIHLDDLLSLDALLNSLHPGAAINDLRQWLEGQFDDKWKSIDELVPTRFRNSKSGSRSVTGGTSPGLSDEIHAQVNSVSRATAIQLTQPDKTVVLVVQIVSMLTPENSLNLRLRLYPDSASTYLPSGLRIAALDESGTVILESQTREASVWTELELLDCHPGERFSVRISIGADSVTEEFCV